MIDYYPPLEAGKFYHVFNRGNNRENLFYNNGNYEYFLVRYDHFLYDFAKTYAFCLLPNHFHLLIRVKEKEEISRSPEGKSITFGKGDTFKMKNGKTSTISKLISSKFRFFFTSYSMSINKQEKRTGSLFQKSFKRLVVDSPKYFANLVHYIHANPQLHDICDDFRQYPWSSYQRILINKPTHLQKDDVKKWFQNKDNYLNYHARLPNLETIRHLIIE